MLSLTLLLACLLLASVGCNGQVQATLNYLTPSTIPHLTSVAVDSTNFLYVLNGTTLIEYNPAHTTQWTLDLSSTLRSPQAIKVDNTGRIYVTDSQRRAVCVFDSDGGAVGLIDGTKGRGSDGRRLTPSGLAFDRSGSLYVVDQANQRVVVFDRSGNVTRYVDVPDGGSRQLLVDVAVDVVGVVYVSDPHNSRVVVLDQYNNTVIGQWYNDYFIQPISLAIDASNLIYVGDTQANITFVFNTAGNLLWEETWEYQLSPRWLAVDASGALYAADVAHTTVGIITGLILPGTVLSVLPGQAGPVALAVTNTSLLLVLNSVPGNIVATQLDAYDYSYSVYPVTAVNATRSTVVAVSNAANFVCQSDNYAVNCYVDNLGSYYLGNLVLTIPSPNGYAVTGLAIDDIQGLIYVSRQSPTYPNYPCSVYVYTLAGRAIEKRDYGLGNTANIAVSPLNSNVYIADTQHDRIVVANRQGTQLHTFHGFTQPTGIAVDVWNNVYVTEVNSGRVVVVDYKGNRLYSIEHGFVAPQSVAVDPYGRIIVADTASNRLVMLQGINLPQSQQAKLPSKQSAAESTAHKECGDEEVVVSSSPSKRGSLFA